MKPFSTYPEDREKLLNLSRAILEDRLDTDDFWRRAVTLADLVRAILEDEAVGILAEGTINPAYEPFWENPDVPNAA